MTIKDLEEAGVTLPRGEWGTRKVRSAVSTVWFFLSAGGAIVGAVLMYSGGGKPATWIGALLYLASLLLATIMLFRAVAPANDQPAKPS